MTCDWWLTVNDKLERIWKYVIVAYLSISRKL